MNPPLSSTNWKKLMVQATTNMFNHMQDSNLFYGELGLLTIAQVEYLNTLDIIEPFDTDFYVWCNVNSPTVWQQVKSNTLNSYLKGQGYRVSNRDIVASSMNKMPSFVDRYQSNWEEIMQIPLHQSDVDLFKRFADFEKIHFKNI